LAFDGAEGAGRFSAGGRGGQNIIVTNLNDSGVGSLRAAIDADGPRIVTFAVAGTIRLQSPLVIRHSRITISGQDAPGSGIAISDYGLNIAADDVIVRYIRSRHGDRLGIEGDAISVTQGRRIILDHISASWSVDETLSVSSRYIGGKGIYDVTVQWSIISESLRNSVHSKGSHGYGSLIRGGHGARFTFHHNLWANHVARMPRPGNYNAVADDPVGPMIEFRSNVFYNWGGKSAGYNADTDSAATYAFVANCYRRGPNSKGAVIFEEENPYSKFWFEGNSIDGVIPMEQREFVTGYWNQLPQRPSFLTAALPSNGQEHCDAVLQHAGASSRRDAVDARVVAGVRSGTGGIIDSQEDVGGWPDLQR
jgi:hypothetical protein